MHDGRRTAIQLAIDDHHVRVLVQPERLHAAFGVFGQQFPYRCGAIVDDKACIPLIAQGDVLKVGMCSPAHALLIQVNSLVKALYGNVAIIPLCGADREPYAIHAVTLDGHVADLCGVGPPKANPDRPRIIAGVDGQVTQNVGSDLVVSPGIGMGIADQRRGLVLVVEISFGIACP